MVLKMGGGMNAKKSYLYHFTIFIIVFLILTPSFPQNKKGGAISITGVIESISRNYKSIVVDNRNVSISSDTKIFDEKGHTLKINHLKPDLFVAVEGIINPEGFIAKKIVVKKPKGE